MVMVRSRNAGIDLVMKIAALDGISQNDLFKNPLRYLKLSRLFSESEPSLGTSKVALSMIKH